MTNQERDLLLRMLRWHTTLCLLVLVAAGVLAYRLFLLQGVVNTLRAEREQQTSRLEAAVKSTPPKVVSVSITAENPQRAETMLRGLVMPKTHESVFAPLPGGGIGQGKKVVLVWKPGK